MQLSLPRFEGRTVLVVGDLMLDRYWRGDSPRISPEAPVPVVQVGSQEDRPGGAANVALNVVALGAACVLVGVVGHDEAGRSLRAMLAAAGVKLDLIELPAWPTTTKLRVVSRQQQLLRLDFEAPHATPTDEAVLARVRRWLPHVHALVLEDYDKGVLDAPEPLIDAARAQRVPVVVDPKLKPFARYRGADVLKPNLAEFAQHTAAFGAAASPQAHPHADDGAATEAAARAVLGACDVRALVLTRGGAGIAVYERDVATVHVPARRVAVFDATGAGDTVAATLGACLAAGTDIAHAAATANVAAGLSVMRQGTVAVSAAELAQAIAADARAERGVFEAPALQSAVHAARAAGERVVFTNGCFDILHAGHVGYLTEARALGDRLIVAVNGDASVRRLKGAGRPVNTLAQRMAVLAALSVVDWVVAFDDDTPEALLEALRPDVLVKGGDYRLDEVVGAERVRAWGGNVRVLAHVPALSTTAIIARAAEPKD